MSTTDDGDPRTRHIKYECSRCRRIYPRNDLIAKSVRYTRLGRGGKVLKTRTVEWLCEACAERDPIWKMDPFKGAPGMKGTSIASTET